ncbi:MAG: hypothetical protein RIB84_21205 [Sneathiellaceae bacterium]
MSEDSSATTSERELKKAAERVNKVIAEVFEEIELGVLTEVRQFDSVRGQVEMFFDRTEVSLKARLAQANTVGKFLQEYDRLRTTMLAATERFEDDVVEAFSQALDDIGGDLKLRGSLDKAADSFADALGDWIGGLGQLGRDTVEELGPILRKSVTEGLRDTARKTLADTLDDLLDWRRIRDQLTSFSQIDLSLDRPGVAPTALGLLSSGQAGLGASHVTESRLTGLVAIASGLISKDGFGKGFSSTLGNDLVGRIVEQFPATSEWLGLVDVPGYFDFAGSWTDAVTSGFGDALATGINSAGWGAIGSFGANLIGLHPRDPMVGALTSGVGSIAGGTLGALGWVGGPAGAVAGAFLGTALSSQIGPNPSVGPNGSAYLGFSNGAFAVGGTGSDNGGSSERYAAIVGEAAATLNEQLQILGLYVKDPSQSFWSFGAGTPGVAPSSYVGSADDLVARVLKSGRLASENPDVEARLSGLSGSSAEMLQALQSAAVFAPTLAALQQATDPTAEIEMAASSALEAQLDSYRSFLSSAADLGADRVAAAEEAVRNRLEADLGIERAVEPLTLVERAFAALEARAQAASDGLAEVGISAGEVAAGAAKLRTELSEDVLAGFQSRLDALQGFASLDTVRGLLDQRDIDRRDAEAAGIDTAIVEEVFGTGLQQVLEGQSLPALQRLIATFADIPEVVEDAKAAFETLVRSVRQGFEAQLNALSGLGILNEVSALMHRADSIRQQVAEAGLSPDLAEALTAGQLQKALAGETLPALRKVIETFAAFPAVVDAATAAFGALSASVREGFAARINSLSGLGALNEVSALLARGPEDLKEAALAGVETAEVRELYRLELERMLGGQGMPALEAIMEAFGEIPLVAQSVQSAIRDLQSRALDEYRQLMDSARAIALSAWQDQAREAESLMDSMLGLADGLARTRQDLASGSLSPLGPEARLQDLAARFGETASRARLGDREALGELSGIAQTYLSAARDYHAATEPYAEIFAEVQDSLVAAEGTATRQASVAEQQLDAAQRQIDLLEEMAAALGAAGSGNPLADYFGAVATGSDAMRLQALARMTSDQIAGALAQFAPGSQEQAQLRRFLGEAGFGDGTQAALREQWQRLGEEAVAGIVTGDVMARQLSILSRADAESLEYFISTMNANGQNAPAARAFLMQYRHGDVSAAGGDGAVAGLVGLADQLDVQTAALRVGNAELGAALGEVQVLLGDILQQMKNGGLAA